MQLPNISGVDTWQRQAALCSYNKCNTEVQGEGQKSSLRLLTEASAAAKRHALAQRDVPWTSCFIFSFTFRVKNFQFKKNKQRWVALLSQT